MSKAVSHDGDPRFEKKPLHRLTLRPDALNFGQPNAKRGALGAMRPRGRNAQGLRPVEQVVQSLLWVHCGPPSSNMALRDECRRLIGVVACTPNQALRYLQGTPRLAAVFDFDDPSPACLQLMQSIKRKCPSVPIVMLTETHSEELAVWAFRARVWNYLVKPVPLRELRANLKQLIALATQRNASESRAIARPATLVPSHDSGPTQVAKIQHLRRVIDGLRPDTGQRISVDAIAAQCGLDRFAFSRLFHKTYGCSCREYLMRTRIEHARKLLCSSHLTVTEAASIAGFADSSYLARMFRRYLGASPTQVCADGSTALEAAEP